jgi:hypothetical protein
MLKFIKAAGLSLSGAVVTLILAGTATFIYFGGAISVESSFWLGFGGLLGPAVVLAASYWASSPKTKQWPGTVIAFSVAVIMLVTGLIWKPFENFSGGDFGLGLATLGLVALMAGAVYGTHLLIKKFAV